jgi:antitoxin (DNA-binding transcriptional repressor) of toxin-antitoxin stability system
MRWLGEGGSVDAYTRIDAKPVVRLVPVVAPKFERRLGEAKGLVQIAEDFDTLPDDLLEHFR